MKNPQRWQRVLVCVAEPACTAAAPALLLMGSGLSIGDMRYMTLSAPGDTDNITPVHNVYWNRVQLPKNVILSLSHLVSYAEATDQDPGIGRSLASAERATTSYAFRRPSRWRRFQFARWKARIALQCGGQCARFNTGLLLPYFSSDCTSKTVAAGSTNSMVRVLVAAAVRVLEQGINTLQLLG